ncbi:hypothetical protein GCM10023322_09000 [Rugosimonospora acidiphila]|uniref:DUF2218 domain-containing protein n=1 Tax=Rugosimonospora acidiphila TaxID=556531 RepID=A0ABP9RK56_9ACTN
MFSAEARIRTDRPGRYLTQLCGHTAQLSVLLPHKRNHTHNHEHGEDIAAMPRRAECSDTEGVIEFDRGRCTLLATGEELVLLAEADDQQQLRLMQDAIAARMRRIGRRDQLNLTWQTRSARPGLETGAPRRSPGIDDIMTA